MAHSEASPSSLGRKGRLRQTLWGRGVNVGEVSTKRKNAVLSKSFWSLLQLPPQNGNFSGLQFKYLINNFYGHICVQGHHVLAVSVLGGQKRAPDLLD